MKDAEAIEYRWMREDELDKLAEIDRSERVVTHYVMRDGELVSQTVDWDVPAFFMSTDGDHSVVHQIAFCRKHLQTAGHMLGAFDDHRLIGVAIWTPNVRPALAQLAYLHVSRTYRRHGIANRLVHEVERAAKASGATQLYVSATPSGSAVGFYHARGFVPTAEPLAELYELEPADIHMIKPL